MNSPHNNPIFSFPKPKQKGQINQTKHNNNERSDDNYSYKTENDSSENAPAPVNEPATNPQKHVEISGTTYSVLQNIPSASGKEDIILLQDVDKKLAYITQNEYQHIETRDKAETPESFLYGSVNQSSPENDKVTFFMHLFRGRADVYGKSYYNTKANKIFYSPVCSNEWISGICGKPYTKCAQCANRAFKKLDSGAIRKHLIGGPDAYTNIVGVYPITLEDTVHFLAIDFDGSDWQKAITAIRQTCKHLQVPYAVERSRSGAGAHVWFFFAEPIPASDARKMGTTILTTAMERCSAIKFESYDRLFPAQDNIAKNGFGNLIALPLQGYARKNNNSVFIDENFEPYHDQWSFLSGIPLVTQANLDRILAHSHNLGTLTKTEDFDSVSSYPTAIESTAYTELETNMLPLFDKDICTKSSAELVRTKSHQQEPPKQLVITLGRTISIPTQELDSSKINELRRLAAFANPDFYKTQAMRMSVYGKPRIISLAELDNQTLNLPRGCQERLAQKMKEWNVEILWEDKRTTGRKLSISFAGTLRPEQSSAVDALLQHENGVLHATTAFGKTVVAVNLIAQLKVPTLIIVHSSALLKQWQQRLNEFLQIQEEIPEALTPTGRKSRKRREAIGCIGAGRDTSSGIIDIALVQSLFEKGEIQGQRRVKSIVSRYGLVICDECHHVPAIQASMVLGQVCAKYVYGLTATPKRADGLEALIFLQCGPVRFKADARQQAKSQAFSRYLVPRFLRTQLPDIDPSNFAQILDALTIDKDRNAAICNDVFEAIKNNRKCLVLTRRIAHAQKLTEKLSEQIPVVLLTGTGSAKEKETRLNELRAMSDSRPFAVVATGSYIGEGFDDSRLDTLFLAAPVAFEGLLAQYVGRLHRDYPGKKNVVVYDYADIKIRSLERMYRKRLKAYAAQQYQIKSTIEDDSAGQFFEGSAYLEPYNADLYATKDIALFMCDFVHEKRVSLLKNALQTLTHNGAAVDIVLNTRPIVEGGKSDELNTAIKTLQATGARITCTEESLPNLVILDRKIVWYGSASLLAFPRKTDQMLRVQSPAVTADLLESLQQVAETASPYC